MTICPRALRERRGGSGTRSGRNASLADFGMIGPFCAGWPSWPPGLSPFWFVSFTGNPFILSSPDSCQAMRQKTGPKTVLGPADPSPSIDQKLLLCLIAPQNKRSVGTAKTERVRQGHVYFSL